MIRFRTIVADPCWSFKNWSEAGEEKNANQHYDCMTVAEMERLPVKDVLTEDAALFMWVTGPFLMLPDPARLARAWGFPHYSGLAFTWAKQSASGEKWHFSTGYWTRHNAEVVALFTRDKKPERRDRGVPELVIAPVGKHSAKPEEVQNRIERLIDGPRLELFARRERPGWTCLGNEITGNDLGVDLRALAMQGSLSL